MSKYLQGRFVCKHPEKYAGGQDPIYRSSWEFGLMQFFDNNPSVITWLSEGVFIPYLDPLTGLKKNYVPDFLVVYVDRTGRKNAELIEIKPSKETTLAEAKSARDRAFVARNHAKWQAATAYCKRNGLTFRIVTEKNLFPGAGKKR